VSGEVVGAAPAGIAEHAVAVCDAAIGEPAAILATVVATNTKVERIFENAGFATE
jgi:hypothetical protein